MGKETSKFSRQLVDSSTSKQTKEQILKSVEGNWRWTFISPLSQSYEMSKIFQQRSQLQMLQ
jgi:hypothetical protein